MEQTRFWDIIESVKHASDKPAAHCKALALALVSLSNDELVEFQFIWDDLKFSDSYLHETLNRVTKKFYSDDGFWFGFIPWLIGQGRIAYATTREDPLHLLLLIPAEKLGMRLENEGLKYVGVDIWKKRTGLEELPDRFAYDKVKRYGHIPPGFITLAKIVKFNVGAASECDIRFTEFALAKELMRLFVESQPQVDLANVVAQEVKKFKETPSENGQPKPNLDE